MSWLISTREICTSAVYSIRFSVEGRGVFPFDMLRWDACYPEHPEAASNMNCGILDQSIRRVDLKAMKCVDNWLPAVERWRNFGWTVVDTKREG